MTAGTAAPGAAARSLPLSTAQPGPTLRALWALREAASRGDSVRWQAAPAGPAGLDLRLPLLHHLPPPVSPRVPGWLAGYRYGLCHYRRGPGFVLVSDARDGTARRFVLDGPERELLLRYTEPGAAPVVDPPLRRLIECGLVLRLGGEALTLACRLRRWPVPCTSV